jgi:hypothetical protein
LGDSVAHVTESPRVETNSPMLRGGAPNLSDGGPTVITPTTANREN